MIAFGACVWSAASCAGPEPPPYLGQPLPGLTPERFAPGIVSTDAVELNGVFAPVGPPINSEFGTGDTYVSPDERYMVFGSRRPPSQGAADLFVSFRGDDGTWSEPVSLGEPINTALIDYCPMVTPDGRFLFFSRRNPGTWAEATEGDVYWVDARILDRFRPR